MMTTIKSAADSQNLLFAKNLQASVINGIRPFADLTPILRSESANLEYQYDLIRDFIDTQIGAHHPIPIGIGGHGDGHHSIRDGMSRATTTPDTAHPSPASIIMALDLGTHTGWAVRDDSFAITSGTEDFKPHRFEGGGMRYLRFKQWLTELKNTLGGMQAVYFEEVRRHKGVDAAHTYGGFMAHLTAWCEHHGIPYQGIPVGTIKKSITGSGNANKQAVIDAVRKLGFVPADDNEADALALLNFILTKERRSL